MADNQDELQDVRETLHRVDERTAYMEEKLDSVAEGVDDNEDDIDKLEGKVKRNTTLLTSITGGIGFVGLWLADKLSRFT